MLLRLCDTKNFNLHLFASFGFVHWFMALFCLAPQIVITLQLLSLFLALKGNSKNIGKLFAIRNSWKRDNYRAIKKRSEELIPKNKGKMVKSNNKEQ